MERCFKGYVIGFEWRYNMTNYRFTKIHCRVAWDDTGVSRNNENEPLLKLDWTFTERKDGKEVVCHESYNRSVKEFEFHFIPMLRIKKGVDPINISILYMNDDTIKNCMQRILIEGTDFISFSGVKILDDGTWIVE